MLEIHPLARVSIDEHANTLLSRLKPYALGGRSGYAFPSELPSSATITPDDILDEPILGDVDLFGRQTGKYFHTSGEWLGIADNDYQELRRVSDKLLKCHGVRRALGAKFVEDAVFAWCRERRLSKTEHGFTDWVEALASDRVRKATLWVPVARLEIEESFGLGEVAIERITEQFLAEAEAELVSWHPDSSSDVSALFDVFRKDMQGLAAVVVQTEAEPGRAEDLAFAAAEAAIGFLRLYSGAASIPYVVCPCAILGAEVIPRKRCITFAEGRRFSAVDRANGSNGGYWRLTKVAIERMKREHLDAMARLLFDEGLTEFQGKLRASLLAYSKGTTLPDIGDRLVYVFSALESLLIRDTSEPLQQNLGERIAFTIAGNAEDRIRVVRNVKAAYKIRSQYVHHRVGLEDEETLFEFLHNARSFLDVALGNIDEFPTTQEFIEAIDRIKFGGSGN